MPTLKDFCQKFEIFSLKEMRGSCYHLNEMLLASCVDVIRKAAPQPYALLAECSEKKKKKKKDRFLMDKCNCKCFSDNLFANISQKFQLNCFLNLLKSFISVNMIQIFHTLVAIKKSLPLLFFMIPLNQDVPYYFLIQ